MHYMVDIVMHCVIIILKGFLMDILTRLKILGSGSTYLPNPELEFYTVMADSIKEIEHLRQEITRLTPVVTTNKKIRYVGDVHGKIAEYADIVKNVPYSVQVGDMGAGFVPLANLGPNHRFIRGNHDSPEVCKNHPSWIRDGAVEGDTMYIGGAWSIDQRCRIPGVSWWHDEELSIAEFQEVISLAERVQPRVIISHDCPASVVSKLFGLKPIETRTQQALNVVIEVCEPELFIFGHWHTNVDMVIGNTRYICLDELAFIDI